jgi:hypothetical protein
MEGIKMCEITEVRDVVIGGGIYTRIFNEEFGTVEYSHHRMGHLGHDGSDLSRMSGVDFLRGYCSTSGTARVA